MATRVVSGLLLFLSAFSACFSQQPHRRFEYKHSFKGPHLMQKDMSVPFWQYGGSAFASDEQVRITPSIRSKRGYIWSKFAVPYDHWEVEFYFKVTGRGRVGADGLAFWYVDKKPEYSPPADQGHHQHNQLPAETSVFGGPDKWNGLAIMFDSFDNDNLRNNPYIMAMSNDGTMAYQHNTDGMSQQIGGCLRDFRNKPYPVRAKIEYYKKTLTVFIHNGWTNIDSNYELCLRREDITLPSGGYFGITAATGGLADDHDVIKFLTHSLTPPDEPGTPDKEKFVSDDEEQRFKKEYDEYYEKLQQQKKDFQDKHPDKVRKELLEDDFFEDTETRELRQIYEVQASISKTIQNLNRKLDEIVGRQERTLSAISAIQSSNRGSSGGAAPPGGSQQALPQASSVMKRHEVDTMLNTQQELQRSIRDVRSVIGEVQAKAGTIQNKMDSGSKQQGNQDILLTHELRDKIAGLSGDVSKLLRKSDQGAVQCPPPQDFPSCLTPAYFIFLLVIQGGFFFLYALYRSKQEAAAKKFY